MIPDRLRQNWSTLHSLPIRSLPKARRCILQRFLRKPAISNSLTLMGRYCGEEYSVLVLLRAA
jgi:hypothetical protein